MPNRCERGIYRNNCFNGVVEYHVYDSNRVLILKAEMIAGYADFTESRIAEWLDLVDPLPLDGLTSPDVSEPPPSSLAA